MRLSSPAFDDNTLIPKQYSRLGGDVSPPLEIGDVPNGAASLALVCHDPDAPYAHGWTHWVVWNIPPTVTNVPEGTVPFGSVQGVTDWAKHTGEGRNRPVVRTVTSFTCTHWIQKLTCKQLPRGPNLSRR